MFIRYDHGWKTNDDIDTQRQSLSARLRRNRRKRRIKWVIKIIMALLVIVAIATGVYFLITKKLL